MRRASHDALRLIGCAALLVLTIEARAGDRFQPLDGKQIRARMVGKDITDGAHWSLYLRPDGSIIGSESGDSWTGSWKIRDERLCMTQPSITSLVCNQVWMSGENIRMRAIGDEKTFEAKVLAHQPNR
ncbi:hypothetical protein XH99_16210 [Bradyrhizobium nanningense]|uniref:Uncharacterized protein n=1 Tax=Bradyrhizobium nanningense TaxID=1325118 RepID=A0A4Q0S329_9BRAD|nr:hypothetical protein [Bradyrhizobium nanningense]RXH27794.1 hypothetical protein XH99_16210 [Bradyrhizobium nanningense]RXH34162.1 hypothetical protein XH84_07265 [Bradyrhizobium nanningense]